ncbi:Predicted phosphoribosyltransferase [Lutibacter agarilyticus]|uniref:Predicted phosphoribosyltransferase n=1 Tax=Lutibacter agarilyticus TaxID=1109740 RepID=A0A238YFP0_9FLAO|nr:phosphoribosyltransferase family protein [Lutibacter agarilyticus]SNR69792.1 Predicted phosphoribosyltransferase [Lutibacter agarilyticus]
MFTNRTEAGNLLAKQLTKYSNHKDVLIVAIPRGGVPVGAAIAEKLNVPLEIVLSKKIGHPINKEYAIGAVTLKNSVITDNIQGVSKTYIEEETQRVKQLLQKRQQWYYGDAKPKTFNNKIIIVVDDGVATGNTLISSIQLIEKENPSKIIVALPVAPKNAIRRIKSLTSVTNIICLLTPANFNAVGQFYENFNQVSDNEVLEILHELA